MLDALSHRGSARPMCSQGGPLRRERGLPASAPASRHLPDLDTTQLFDDSPEEVQTGVLQILRATAQQRS